VTATARLTISLSSLSDNYRRLNRHATGDVAAVVKANAYGLGLKPVATSLWQCGCREFFVATLAEGIALRAVLGEAIIYVLSGAVAGTVATFVTHGVIPVLNTPSQVVAWQGQSAAAAVHVDTGMARLGLAWQDAEKVLQSIDFPLALLISHFARADEVHHGFSALQKQRFFSLCRTLQGRGLPGRGGQLRISLCNSAAILDGLCQSDSETENLGRGGIAMYGGNPFHNQPNPMDAVVKLEGQIVQVRTVESGQAVGYGGTYVATDSTRVATVGLGYADGVPRLLSNRGRVFVNGKFSPIIGRISMDLLQIDVSNCAAQEGDWVEVFGRTICIDECASHAETLSYEILTGIGRRPERSYINESLS